MHRNKTSGTSPIVPHETTGNYAFSNLKSKEYKNIQNLETIVLEVLVAIKMIKITNLDYERYS